MADKGGRYTIRGHRHPVLFCQPMPMTKSHFTAARGLGAGWCHSAGNGIHLAVEAIKATAAIAVAVGFERHAAFDLDCTRISSRGENCRQVVVGIWPKAGRT